jgi:outer membrane protein
LLAALAMPSASRAQGEKAPPTRLDLDQAVRLTLELSPEIRRAAQEVALAQGRLRETSGTFDSSLRVSTTLGYVETELDPDTIENEEARRIALFSVAQTFAKLRDDLADNIAQRRLQVPICPPGFTLLRLTDRAETDLGLSRPICIPVGLGVDTPEGLLSRANSTLFGPPGSVDLTELLRRLRMILGLPADERIDELEQLGLEQLERSQRLASLIADQSVLSLDRFGLVPETEFRKTLALQLSLSKPLRSGTLFALEGRLSGQELNFRGKPLDPAFGGLGIENEFRAGLFLIVNQPLGKGRGSVSADAAERAAAASLEAARRRQEQAVSERALGTIRAHLDLLAAQESLALLEQSVAAQGAILQGVEQLVQAGERARSELTRSQAGLADAESSAADARLSVLAARAELARVVGLDAAKVGIGPLAGGSFPAALVEVPDLQALQQQAVAARLDLRAAQDEERAAVIAFEAARSDLKRRFDLFVNVGMASDYRSPFFRVIKDEFVNNPTEPPEDPVDYYDPRGFGRALSNKYLPEIRVQLAFDIPFGNNAARGRLERNLQALRQREIRSTDLARVIRENVAEVGTSLRAARGEVEERRQAVSQHEATWNAAQELRRAGELSLVDTLLTEQDLTSARLQLVEALRSYSASLARLRFEAGTLVRFQDGRPVGFYLEGLLSP